MLASGLVFTSHHLAASSIMDYLKVFGMEGTSLEQPVENQYTMTGLKAGMVFATMGNTGTGTAPHVDFRITRSGSTETSGELFLSLFFKDGDKKESLYPNLEVKQWAKDFSGFASRDYGAAAIRKYLVNYRKTHRETQSSSILGQGIL